MAELRGTVRATSQPGVGATFTVECPASLITVRALLVAVGSQTVAVPTAEVERVSRLAPDAVRRVEGREVITTGGAPVPLVPLAALLPPLTRKPPEGHLLVVLLCVGEQRLAVTVDELIGEQEIVMRPLGKVGAAPPHVSAAAIIGSGKVALVLNATSVIAAGLAAPPDAAGAGAAAPGEGGKKRILVVDDSITTRSLERSILEAAGYDVITAVDGADAWRALQTQAVEAVVADVEMPRMDGFALCEAIRGSSRFREMPVVLVTALELPEHRARGLEVGASAYLGKSMFDQQNLVDALRQLIG
jgi:two-component system chemotaxis sensor kinase CheA